MERIPLTRQLAAGATGGLALMALAVFLRRVTGGIRVDLPPGEVLVDTALFAVACLVAGHSLAKSNAALRQGGATSIAVFVTSLIFLAGLSTAPVTILAGTVVIAGLVGLSTVAAPADASRRISGETAPSESVSSAVAIDPVPTAEPTVESNAGLDDQPGLCLVRTGTAPHEQVEGTIRFETLAGETAATLHVPLWPPLAGSPAVTCELEGIDGRVTVPYAKPHGFRIEVRLAEAFDEPLEGLVRFVARSSAAAAAA